MTQYFIRTDEKPLRKAMPQAERLVWSVLKGRTLDGHRFRRQYSVGAYVVDFYCPALKLAVELDGESHDVPDSQKRDGERDAFIESLCIRILRVSNAEVCENLEGVWEGIRKAANERVEELGLDPPQGRPRERRTRANRLDTTTKPTQSSESTQGEPSPPDD